MLSTLQCILLINLKWYLKVSEFDFLNGLSSFNVNFLEQFSIPIRQGVVTIPSAAREVIDDIITKSSLTIEISETDLPKKVTSPPTPVEETISVPPKCPELDHSQCCPCPAAITTNRDVVAFAAQYDPHYTQNIKTTQTWPPEMYNDNLDADFSTEKLSSG